MDSNLYQLAKINNDPMDLDSNKETTLHFSEENDEFLEFKNNVKDWLLLDDDIITLQNAIKDRKVKKMN